MAVVFGHTAAGFSQIGGLAVNLFFALSGYLIVENLHRMRQAIDAGQSTFADQLNRFWIRRTLRIMPAYYVVIIICLLILAWLGRITLIESLFFLTYTQNFLIAQLGTWMQLSHTWTLAVEQQFYILIAPLLLLLPAARHPAFLLGCATVTTIASIAGLFILPAYFPTLSPFAFARWPIIGFLLGCAGGYLAIRRDIRISTPVFTIMAFICVLISALPALYLAERPSIDSVNFLFQVIACPVIIAYVATHQTSRIVAWLDSSLLIFLGQLSYSLYLVHYLVAELVKEHWPVDLQTLTLSDQVVQKLLIFLATSAISIALAYLNYRFVEMRFISRKSTPRFPAGVAKA
ncbi:hypothetical protein BJF93_07320 [Xaviernesmea oryzae]|uniref:Acyltransferase 3 domain-containing protein n=2 Tax=Xaviernesmea oryzae TaxID=464029 RepID=A0A1Q9B1P5_9HYPH|nr:hypothetical protein BJF93_07320 [Xaviernesmea oryzae]